MGDALIFRPEKGDIDLEVIEFLAENAAEEFGELEEVPPEEEIASYELASYDVIMFYGHGSVDAWLSTNGVFLALEQVSFLSQKRVYACACSTAVVLGPAASSAGAVKYAGYSHQVEVPWPPEGIPEEVLNEVNELSAIVARAISIGDVNEEQVFRELDRCQEKILEFCEQNQELPTGGLRKHAVDFVECLEFC